MNKLIPVLLLATLGLSGCYKIVLTDGGNADLKKNNPAFHHIGVFSLVEFSKPIPVHEMCPGGFSRIDVRENVLTSLIGNVTYKLYSPSQTFVQCKGGKAFVLGIDDAGAVAEAVELDMGSVPADI
jgi:hypothetical protein